MKLCISVEWHNDSKREKFLAALELRWWCEARVDTVLGYSDETLRALKRAGSTMIFFGAESGSDWVLRQMNKQLKAEQTLALAERIRHFAEAACEVAAPKVKAFYMSDDFDP